MRKLYGINWTKNIYRHFVFLLCVFSYSTTIAQRSSTKIIEISEVSSLKFSNATEQRNLQSLLDDAHSSIYFLEGIEKMYGTSPRVIFTDVQGLRNLTKLYQDTSTVELLRIEILQNQGIKISAELLHKQFPKLKYVYFLLSSITQKEELLRNSALSSSDLLVLYQILNRS